MKAAKGSGGAEEQGGANARCATVTVAACMHALVLALLVPRPSCSAAAETWFLRVSVGVPGRQRCRVVCAGRAAGGQGASGGAESGGGERRKSGDVPRESAPAGCGTTSRGFIAPLSRCLHITVQTVYTTYLLVTSY